MIVGVAEDTNWACWAAGVGSWEQAGHGRQAIWQAVAGGGRIIMRHEAPAGGGNGNPNYYQIGMITFELVS